MADKNKVAEQTVTQHNDLVRAVAEMDRMPLKLFEIIVGAYDERKNQTTVYIKKQLVYDLMDINDRNRVSRLRKVLTDLHQHATFHFKTKEVDGSITEYSISPIQEIMWNHAQDDIKVVFAPKLLPYISLLQSNFTKYRLADVARLNSKHAIIIYKLLAMNYNQYQYYASRKFNSEKLDEFANPTITIKELRRLTSTENKYLGRFSSFETKVLKLPLKEINENTAFSISYDKVKRGRQIYAIQFHVTKNDITVTDNGLGILQSAEYQRALNSPYTPLLATNQIIDMVTLMQDQSLVLSLASEVYPLYEKIVSDYGENALNKHLSYLKEHMNKVAKKGLTDYLAKAAQNRIDQLKNSSNARKTEEMPAWTKKSSEELTKKATPEEIASLKQRIANRKKK